MNRRSLAVIAASALAAVGIAFGVNAVVGTGHRPTTAAPAAVTTTDALPPLVDAAKVPDVTAADLATAKTFGWDVAVEQPVDSLTAAQADSRRLAVSKMRGPVVGVSLARVTIHGYGDPIDPAKSNPANTDPAADDNLDLKVKDALVWVAVARQVPMPVLGPSQPADAKSTGPRTELQDIIMLIEPGKDRILVARTLTTDS
ncbi:hypothetical protein [Kineosporia sp. A_224]|uniref:hypothetical protein n=1 Tax=Kineosporia sp. A_224 TaxID=1962180 RepID=UPI000B4B6105|nr:hypothetical protein [Kineosporia sp. A_224]